MEGSGWPSWLPQNLFTEVLVAVLFSPAGAMVGIGLVCLGVGWYLERKKRRGPER
jgi:hypothetical protein